MPSASRASGTPWSCPGPATTPCSGPASPPRAKRSGSRGKARAAWTRQRGPVPSEVPPAGSAADQPALPLVDQDEGDERRLPRPDLAGRGGIAGRQFLEFLPARGGGEQGLQLLLPLREALLRGHVRPRQNGMCAVAGEAWAAVTMPPALPRTGTPSRGGRREGAPGGRPLRSAACHNRRVALPRAGVRSRSARTP